jgi:LmbE family N-acetylglucosaminyl deacetylase
MRKTRLKNVAIIVAHPDDETLWAGGTILGHPQWTCFIVCLCRASDQERAPLYYNVLKLLKSEGVMGDLDDGPEQRPLSENEVAEAITILLPKKHYDLIISHNPSGEYTKHIRHEEISRAVINLWHKGQLNASELWTFAYEDGNGEYFPRPIKNAPIYFILSKQIWLMKYRLIIDNYHFTASSWEAKTTPHAEAFWQFKNPQLAKNWLTNLREMA